MIEGKPMRVPPDISARINDEISNVYIFYYNERALDDDMYFGKRGSRNEFHGFCTSCGGWVYLNNCRPKHNERILCPCCYREATLKAGGRGRKKIKESKFVRAFRIEPDDSVRLYEIAVYNEDYTDFENELAPRNSYMRVMRLHVITAEGWETYKTDSDGNAVKMKKPRLTPVYIAYGVTENGYASRSVHFLDEDLSGTCLKYIAQLIGVDKTNYVWWIWFEAYLGYPYLEQLEKNGYDQLCHDLVMSGYRVRFLNFRAKNPAGFVRCGNKRVKAKLRELIRLYNSVSIPILDNAKELFETREDFLPEFAVTNDFCQKAAIYKKLPAFGSRKICNFLEKLSSTELDLYEDYLKMAEQTGTDLTKKGTAFPKDIRAEHDRLIKRMNEAKTAEKEREVEERYKKLCKSGIVGYTFGGLTVLAPAHAMDIIIEGQCQNNCVGSYLNEHASGETSIFFIRRADKPDVSYFTLELRLPEKKGEIAEIEQCYGYGNEESYKKNLRVSRFLEKYIRHISYCFDHKKLAEKYHRRKVS